LELVSLAMLMAVCIGIPLGMWAGLKTESMSSRTIMAGSIFGFSLPSFWVGMMLVVVFSITLGWLPTSGRGETVNVLGVGLSFLTLDGLRHLILPVLNLSLFPMSLVIRLTRAGMQETLPLDFVKLARAKGLTTRRVILVHVLKNILIPIVTVIGINFGGLLAFAVVTETVFAWPGMGKLIIDSINLLDRPVVVAYLLLTVLMFTIINLVVDILYSVLDPRVRLGDQKQ
jgi:peptide/nickel transport system permease protein